MQFPVLESKPLGCVALRKALHATAKRVREREQERESEQESELYEIDRRSKKDSSEREREREEKGCRWEQCTKKNPLMHTRDRTANMTGIFFEISMRKTRISALLLLPTTVKFSYGKEKGTVIVTDKK